MRTFAIGKGSNITNSFKFSYYFPLDILYFVFAGSLKHIELQVIHFSIVV